MKIVLQGVSAALTLVLACGGAASPPKDVTRMQDTTKPQPRLEPLVYFLGAWTAEARNPGTGQTFTLSYAIAPALDGAWLDGVGHAPALGLRVHDRWGIDHVTGEIVRVVFDSTGLWGVIRAKGWEGERLVLEGEANTPGGVVRVRETITKVSPSEFGAVWEAFQDGTWTAYSIERLTK